MRKRPGGLEKLEDDNFHATGSYTYSTGFSSRITSGSGRPE